jgi:hypothetical protein
MDPYPNVYTTFRSNSKNVLAELAELGREFPQRAQPSHLITGRNLAHAHRNAHQRAGIAAQLVLGEVHLVKPTITQVAPVAHVSVPYVQLALRLKVETRARVARGELSLIEATKANGLLTAWIASTPEERAALGAAVGVNEIWDHAIQPSV